MSTKKKAKKKQPKSQQATRNKKAAMRRPAKKKIALKEQTTKKKAASKAAKKRVAVNAAGKKSKSARRKPIRRRSQTEQTAGFSPKRTAVRSGGQSGDLQGLSSVEAADSESVVELLEEGNAFEAAVVAGVENAGNTEPSEVRTHEVLEDDVPEEYLDRD